MPEQTLIRPVRAVSGAYPRAGAPLGQITRDAYFDYAQTFTFPVGTENFQVTIPIQSDAHFICMLTKYDNSLQVGASGGTTFIAGGALILVTDTSSQRQLASAQVPINSLFGTAQRPYVWPFTHLFRANGGISISITGIGVAVAGQVIRVVFSGIKIPIGQAPELGL
jgi:hypothetical protein